MVIEVPIIAKHVRRSQNGGGTTLQFQQSALKSMLT